MKKFVNTALLLLLFLGLSAFKKPKIQSEWVIERNAYSLSYDGLHKQARWVYEFLTAKNLQGKAERENCTFLKDSLIPNIVSSSVRDYRDSGFDRGHLCPAADACSSEEKMRETFYLTNISPQLSHFNRVYWLKLENHVRELTKQYKALHVFTGPLYMPQEEKDGKKYIKYQVIGPNEVAVPTHYFKVIFAEKEKNVIKKMAFIVPNKSIDERVPLDKFKTTIDKVEKAAGFVFNSLD